MDIGGLQKHSLVDFPGRSAIVVFTQGCNWCCPYCHNAELIGRRSQSNLTEFGVLAFLETRPPEARNLVISGGEPTLQDDLLEFMAHARRNEVRLKLDTNGSNPQMLKQVIDSGLADYIALDVKGPLARYDEFCGKAGAGDIVRESIELLRASEVDYEFRCTVVPSLHREEDFDAIGAELKGGRRFVLQPFRKDKVLSAHMRNSPEPTYEYLQTCAYWAAQWLPTQIRGFKEVIFQPELVCC